MWCDRHFDDLWVLEKHLGYRCWSAYFHLVHEQLKSSLRFFDRISERLCCFKKKKEGMNNEKNKSLNLIFLENLAIIAISGKVTEKVTVLLKKQVSSDLWRLKNF